MTPCLSTDSPRQYSDSDQDQKERAHDKGEIVAVTDEAIRTFVFAAMQPGMDSHRDGHGRLHIELMAQ
jgi:hypothetical protein